MGHQARGRLLAVTGPTPLRTILSHPFVVVHGEGRRLPLNRHGSIDAGDHRVAPRGALEEECTCRCSRLGILVVDKRDPHMQRLEVLRVALEHKRPRYRIA